MARGFEITTGLVIQQGIFEESSTAKHKVGTRMQLADGRVFYYAKAGGTLTVGSIASSPIQDADFDICAVTTVAAGAKAISVTPAGSNTVAANDYAEGYVVIQTASTGGGQIAKIKSSGASASNAAIVCTLYDPLLLGVSATATAEIIKNLYWQTTLVFPLVYRLSV
jgi:phage baseplate assembly protein gpV